MTLMLSRLQEDRVFAETEVAMLAVDRKLVIRAANPSYLAATGRELDELVGVPMFEAFPDNPGDPHADGVAKLGASLETVLRHARTDRMALQRYDIRVSGPSTDFVRKFWDPVNSPLRDECGAPPVGVLHQVVDVTDVLDPILEDTPTPSSDVRGNEAWSRLVSTLVAEVLAHRQTRTTKDQLQRALASRIVIEQAKGVLAARHQCTPEDAFEILRGLSRSSRTSIHEVARRLVDERWTPEAEPGAARPS